VLLVRRICFTALFFLTLHFSASSQFYTGSQLQFGKNRVQYDNFVWNYFDYSSYKVYFYIGGEKVARYVGDKAKEYISELSGLMDYQLEGGIEFVVFNKESEYKQSNLGLTAEDQYNTGGLNRIVGRKVILYFEGDHAKLNEQIRLGIAEVMFNEMMYGGSFTNVIRSSTLLNIPPWFEQGFIYYAAKGWSPEIDNHVRDGIESGRYKKFNHLTGADATYAGISLWNYIAQTYGETVIPNVLYLTRTSRSVESAFLFVLGASLKSLSADWLSYYTAQYKKDKTTEMLPKGAALVKKPKANRTYYHARTSPDGKYAVYAVNNLGKTKIILYDLETKKKRTIIKQGEKINRVLDYSYPIMAWHPSGELFSFILETKGKLMLYTYTLSDHKLDSRRIVNFQKILDIAYSDDGTKFAMSAVQDGQSDIFVFTAASNAFEQITKDVYDDLTPRFVDHSTKIVFSSNRPDDTLRLGGDFHKMQKHLDVFEYDFATHSRVLRQITNTPDIDETNPMGYNGDYISYLSSASGVVNRYLAHIDSTISYVDTSAHYRYIVNSFPITDYARNIIEQDAPNSLRNSTKIIYYNGKYWMYQDTLSSAPGSFTPTLLKNTTYMSMRILSERKKKYEDSLAAIIKKDTTPIIVKYPVVTPVIAPLHTDTLVNKQPKKDSVLISPAHIAVDINDYSFENNPPKMAVPTQQPVIVSPPVVKVQQPVAIVKDTAKHDSGKKHPLERQDYHVSFSPGYVLTQIDNSFLNSSYQQYTGGGAPVYLDPGFDVFIKVGLSDLFEDYRIDGGVRLAGNLDNNEYYLSYEDLSKRMDKQLILHREANLNVTQNGYPTKIYTHEAIYMLKWPFSEVARVQGSIGVRDDKTVYQSIDLGSLEQPNAHTLWTHAEMDYVYDATIPVSLNINYGMRAKVFAQYYRNMSMKGTSMYILGFDVRHYQKISRDLIWANRLAAGTSFGQQELLYYMGGVDNWFSPQFNSAISIAQDQHYAFQTLATPMRGFDQNIRNGNNFILYNSEIRFPIFHYLINHPIKSDFFNNFQLIGFFDAGTAWTGLTPYSNENSLNEVVVGAHGNPITVILSTQQDPFVEGFGGGLRTRILGYFVRLDDAWGISNGTVATKPITYFSLTLDF
jgi:hypothetical protein